MEDRISFSQYIRMRERTHDHATALARTNLAVQLLRRRKGKSDSDSDADITYRELMWLLDNHIVQTFYRRYGIDVQCITIGDMYGYGRKVGVHRPICMRGDLSEKLSLIATGSSRIDSHDREEFHLRDELEKGTSLLQAIDEGAMFAVGNSWPSRCRAKGCLHHHDAGVYLPVFQILTLLVVMGWFKGYLPILGTWVNCSSYEIDENEPKHPLLKLGLMPEPCFSPEWFDCGILWINRHDGRLVLQNDYTATVEQHDFAEWCGGSVEHGLHWLMSRKLKLWRDSH